MITGAERLKAVQVRLNLSQQELADYLGVSIGTLRNWVQGVRPMPVHVVRLLDVLGMVEAMAPGLHLAMMPTRRVE